MTITLLDVFAFIFGLAIGIALGKLFHKGTAMIALLVILLAIGAYYGLTTAQASSLISLIGSILAGMLQFIASGLAVLAGNVTTEGMISLGGMTGFVVGLATAHSVRIPVYRRYVRAARGQHRHYVQEDS